MSGQLTSFLIACARHDFRRDIATLDGSSVARELCQQVLEVMRSRHAILPAAELSKLITAQAPGGALEGVEWMVDYLLVLQVGAVVRDLVELTCDKFESSSVPDDIFWRKNAATNWSHQCLPNRFGWFSDAQSVRDLLDTLLMDRSATRFARTMGFTQQDGEINSGYGPMYFMFYTKRQLSSLTEVQFFRPTWSPPTIVDELEMLFERRATQDVLEEWVPSMWSVDADAWRLALRTFRQITSALNEESARVKFLDFSIRICKPLWDTAEGWPLRSIDPRWHPVAAGRHLLDTWFGANHLFMGDGFAWSEDRKKGHAEWLGSSFENFEMDRVSIFPIRD